MINRVIDLSHYNEVTSFADIYRWGIRGVIHKATQGINFVDTTYATRRQDALKAGLLWGAYHFGEAGEVAAQVEHFLDTVQPMTRDLLVLDWEDYGQETMTRSEAEEFVERLTDAGWCAPGLYSGQNFLMDQLADTTSSVLSASWLWVARYSTTQPEVPPLWPTWTMWQYTDGTQGPPPYAVSGVDACDRDRFNGTLSSLRRLWGVQAAPTPRNPARQTSH